MAQYKTYLVLKSNDITIQYQVGDETCHMSLKQGKNHSVLTLTLYPDDTSPIPGAHYEAQLVEHTFLTAVEIKRTNLGTFECEYVRTEFQNGSLMQHIRMESLKHKDLKVKTVARGLPGFVRGSNAEYDAMMRASIVTVPVEAMVDADHDLHILSGPKGYNLKLAA